MTAKSLTMSFGNITWKIAHAIECSVERCRCPR